MGGKNYLRNLLSSKSKNIYSQHGEDGIIETIFEAINVTNQWCLEVGAADGIWLSNTRHLIEKGWKAVLIECRDEEYKQLCKNSPDSYCIHVKIEPEGDNSIDAILDKLKVPESLDLISIDIDGQDYHIWDRMQKHSARVIIIEFAHRLHLDKSDVIIGLGKPGKSGLRAIQKLANNKGYAVVAITKCNIVCVKNNLLSQLETHLEKI